MSTFSIVIPCYNEASRIPLDRLSSFLLTNAEAHTIFVNDGSSDETFQKLTAFISQYPDKCDIVSHEERKGKASAVQSGMLRALHDTKAQYIGYLDADFSTDPEGFFLLYLYAQSHQLDYIFGSRIKKLNAVIKRNNFRHYAGRFIATLTDGWFKLGIYDTQCGAKCFKREIVSTLFEKPFKTKWLFDIEIFIRIKQSETTFSGYEYPLQNWINARGSKINLKSFPQILKELFLLRRFYAK